MNLRILEGLYYLVTIIVSVGFLRNIFNTLTVSSSLEIIFINKPQRFLLKIWFFIKYFFYYIYLCIVYVYIINSFKIGFSLADFLTYSSFLFFCDYARLSIFKNTAFLKLYSKLVKRTKDAIRYLFIIFFSILLTVISHYAELYFKNIFVLQFLFLFCFIALCTQKRKKEISGKHFRFNLINTMLILTPLIIKTILILNNNSILNVNINSLYHGLKLSEISSYVNKIFLNEDSINIIILVIILSVFMATLCVKRDTNLPSFLIYKNKFWKITNITTDKYAICQCNNCMFAVKIDIIKDNYYCEHIEENFYFKLKDDILEIDNTNYSN